MRGKMTLIALAAVVGAGVLLQFGSGSGSSARASQAGSDVSLTKVTDDAVELEFTPPSGKSGILEAELYDLDGKLLAKVSRRHRGRTLKVVLYAQVNKEDPSNYYVRYRFGAEQQWRQRSLLFAGEMLETTVLGQREFLAGTRPVIRVMVRDRAAGAPVAGANVEVELVQGEEILAKYTARSDENGEVAAKLDMPAEEVKDAKLRVVVTTEQSTDKIEQNIRIRSALKTLLTTDKPLYQPGQTIHIRSLTLSQPSMNALDNADVLFEVEDAKGNKVFKKPGKTDEFGIASVDFVLANELNMGTYKVRAIVAGAKEEKTVTVERYVLPKFKVNFESDRSYYQPGETVNGELQVDYFFGKPVAGGKVQIKCSKFDVAYQDFKVIEGKTDDGGHYKFEVKLPDHFVGQPLEAGKASAKFEISVTDTADHKETIVKNVSVTASPIVIAAVPESGELVPGLENRVYIVTTYADSTPASCDVDWSLENKDFEGSVNTDQGGFAEITLTPEQASMLVLNAKDEKGQKGRARIQLKLKEKKGDEAVLVRTNKSLYKVGDKAAISVISTRRSGTVYVDVIKDRQTYLTRTLELKDGKASDTLGLDASLSGTVQVNAYLIGGNGVIVRDRRVVLVDPADELGIEISGDSETYLPGAEAQLKFKVTNKRGKGVASALGVIVVDEAVFALQQMQPGLEKVYFYLEKEIATPRYEIHGYEIDQCITPIQPMPRLEARRDSAAKVLLASAKGVGDYTLHVNTYERDNKQQALEAKMAQKLMPTYQKLAKAMAEFAKKHKGILSKRFKEAPSIDYLVEEGYIQRADAVDPWGGEIKMVGQWCENCQNFHGFVVKSAGIDRQWDTADDASVPAGVNRGGMDGRFRRANVVFDAVAAEPMMKMEMAEGAAPRAMAADAGGGGGGGGGKAAAEPVRIRRYFPETLYFNPAVITDGRGRATLNVRLADSITTWRLTCMASSAVGQLGSTTAGLRVFQDFFVDIDFPVSLTQNDEVHVPVAIYNYLKTDQTIRLEVTKEDWFELKDLPVKTVTLGPGEVRAVYFGIVAKKIGFQKFTVTARGTKKSDAVARTVEIAPDGKEFLISESGRLKGAIRHTITIPENAIDGASKIFVKVYPGVLSQVVEGLDKMLRMPFGCFEQTSSVTYPNVLVLDYMKSAGKITPELQMKAEGFINSGYQRLLSFEVDGGGFEWFGKAPAHRILTAYGLMEFYDMSKVYDVDPAVISRTQNWLAKCQENDGSYKPSQGGIREGAINKFTDDVFRNTAYITWALASTGYAGPEVAKGTAYLKAHLDDMKDNYTIALTANALAAVDAEDKTTLDVLQTLLDKKVEQDGMVYWPATSETPTHGTGETAAIEITGLAVQAFIQCERELGTVSKAVTYLVKKKDAYGTWQSTQATIQALKAMLMAERGATAKADATIDVKINQDKIATLRVDDSNSDVLQLVDLKDRTGKGAHEVELAFAGEGALLYQVVGRYYMPYKGLDVARQEPMSIDVEYDRTELSASDIIGVKATVENNRPGKAKMVIVDLGLPPGFTLIPDRLNALVETGVVEKYSTTGRQIIVYLREVEKGSPVTVEYQLLAKYPLKAKTTKSAAYEYYNPEIRAEEAPIELTVTK